MTDKDIKTSRASQSRQAEEKPKVWTPPNAREAPPAPDGYRQRWLATEIRGQDNSNNITNKLRAGWSLVRADAYPGQHYNSHTEGKYAGMIGSGGLVLARIPEEIALQIDAYYKKQNEDKEEAVETNLLKEQHPSMRFSKESNTRVTFGGTKKS